MHAATFTARHRCLAGSVVAAIAIAAGGSTSRAAEYTVYGASEEHPETSVFTPAADGYMAASSGGLSPGIATFAGIGKSIAFGQQATWTLAVPGRTTVSGFSMTLWCDSRNGWQTGLFHRSAEEQSYEDFAPVQVGEDETVLCDDGEVATGEDVTGYFPDPESSGLQLRSRCVAVAGCTGSGAGGPGGAIARDFAVTIDDPDPPTIQSVDGALFTGGQLWGKVGTTFAAVDAGSGISRATLTIDGVHAGSVQESCSVVAVPPCKESLQRMIVSSTAGLATGVDHTAVLQVEDYAGNSATDTAVFTLASSGLGPFPPDILAALLDFMKRKPQVQLDPVRKHIKAGDRILVRGSVVDGGAIAYYGGRVHLQLSRNTGKTWKTLRTTRVRNDDSFRAHVRLKLPAKTSKKRGRRSKVRASKVWLSAALAESKTSAEMVARSNIARVAVRNAKRGARRRARK